MWKANFRQFYYRKFPLATSSARWSICVICLLCTNATPFGGLVFQIDFKDAAAPKWVLMSRSLHTACAVFIGLWSTLFALVLVEMFIYSVLRFALVPLCWISIMWHIFLHKKWTGNVPMRQHCDVFWPFTGMKSICKTQQLQHCCALRRFWRCAPWTTVGWGICRSAYIVQQQLPASTCSERFQRLKSNKITHAWWRKMSALRSTVSQISALRTPTFSVLTVHAI